MSPWINILEAEVNSTLFVCRVCVCFADSSSGRLFNAVRSLRRRRRRPRQTFGNDLFGTKTTKLCECLAEREDRVR